MRASVISHGESLTVLGTGEGEEGAKGPLIAEGLCASSQRPQHGTDQGVQGQNWGQRQTGCLSAQRRLSRRRSTASPPDGAGACQTHPAEGSAGIVARIGPPAFQPLNSAAPALYMTITCSCDGLSRCRSPPQAIMRRWQSFTHAADKGSLTAWAEC